MKDQLALLRELQDIDLQLDEISSQKKEIQDRLNENRDNLDMLVGKLDHQKAELEDVRQLKTTKESDHVEIIETLKERKKRLLNVGSTKEYNAVEKEIEVLQKSQEQTEEEILTLDEVIESTVASIAKGEEMTGALRDNLAEEEAAAENDLVNFDKQIHALEERTKAARSDVSKRVIYKYDFIRSRRPGLAIVAARDGHCEGCFMALPPQLFIQIQRGETLETCPSCQRILYFWEDAVLPEAANA